MTQEEKVTILSVAEAIFFEAMLDGYAGGKNRKSTKINLNNGCTKKVVFRDDQSYPNYIVEDEWDVYAESDHSAGTTRILYMEKPIWRMFYGGHYPEGAIPFLKSSIAKAYEKKLFLGGRGLAKVIGQSYELKGMRYSLMYKNNWSGDFKSFNGIEQIFQNPLSYYDPELIGYHQYFGMALI